jgi:hypothetical protein
VNDSLTSICGLSELSFEERQPLIAEVDYAGEVLARIDRGAGFCEDRGFPWTAEMERAEGSDRVLTKLREWPIFRRLLPRLRHLRHEAEPLIGTRPAPMDDVRVARLLLTNTRRFTGRCGEGWGESLVEVEFRPDLIQVREATFATALSGRPFHESEYSSEYIADYFSPFWSELREKLDAESCRDALALAGRMARAAFPCDRCGEVSQTLSLVGTVLTYDGPFSAPASVKIGPEVLSVLRDAFAALDMPAIRTIHPVWTEGYCATCDASYCKKHLQRGQEGSEDIGVKPYARCPLGHCWTLS